ncbi:hypothetical protein HanIR_Chr03g0117221 [Helianthus annuus]|nr:hypothetical protein HanIR_Chr03g0117221 [Helianthus annuus]
MHSQLYIYVVLIFMFILHSYSCSYILCFQIHLYNFFYTYILFILKPSCFTPIFTFISMLIHRMLTLILVFILIRIVFILILMFVLTFMIIFHTRYAYTCAHTLVIRFVLCSYAYSYLNFYYAHAFIHTQNSYIRTVRERNPRDSLLLAVYYLKRKHTYRLHFYTHAISFSEFMYTLIHTQLVQALRIMRQSV